MIWALEFDKYWESKDFHTDAHSALLSVYDIFRRRKLNCFLIYRYKLPNLYYDWVNPRTIPSKWGTSDPDLLDFSKITDCKYVILYHLDTFKKKPERLREFYQWAVDNNVDVIIPIKKDFKHVFDINYWVEIKKITEEFQHIIFPVKEVKDEFRFQKLIERELNLDDLLS
jgi:hypothetical protein